MNISFEGKRVLVTGAGQGIGKDLALRLSKFNATVIALSKTKKNLEELKKLDPKIQTVCVDLRNWDETRKAVESVLPIDLLVNNAGVGLLKGVFESTKEDFDLLFDVNVKAAFNVSQVVAKNLIDRKVPGSIVNLSSQASKCALPGHVVYCSSKGALDMLTQTMALELGPHNIRVNTVHPTVVMTEMSIKAWNGTKMANDLLSRMPLGRFAEIDEVIDAVVFLLSDRSSMTTGVGIPVEGGIFAV